MALKAWGLSLLHYFKSFPLHCHYNFLCYSEKRRHGRFSSCAAQANPKVAFAKRAGFFFFWTWGQNIQAFLCSPKCRPQGQHGGALKSAHPRKNAPQSVFLQCPCRKACLGIQERPELNPGKIRSGKTHLMIKPGTAGGKIRLTEVLAQQQEETSEGRTKREKPRI